MIIYHNPRCSKSRETLQIIRDHNIEPQIIEYLKEVPSEELLKTLLMKLNIKPFELIRTGEDIFKTRFRNANFTDDEWVKIMVEFPKLIERPIVVKDYKAIIGRPPSNVLDLINE